MTSDSIDFDRINAVVADFAEVGGPPGIAYGVVIDGQLAHSGGWGARRLDGPVPDADTVFRIASMSKSFTASVIMTLRDEGAVELDAPAAEYVPELRGWAPLTADSGAITVRQLLTMTAGLPTDDPWGDRQQGLPFDEFGELLAAGVSRAWVPGTRFDYSNLGYAILGRLIGEVTGAPYRDVVRDRLLWPLGMTSTGFEAADFDTGRLAHGYRRAGDGWDEVPFDPYGAFAPMGGIFSTVADLARWVAGFAAAFPPATGNTADDHPVARASRREMQLPQVTVPEGRAGVAYGYGLFVEQDPQWGRIVTHSGGYPGFGSNMRWHAATGTGVIALGNATYTSMTALATRLQPAVLRGRRRLDALALAPGQRPWPQTLAAQEAVNSLLRDWDDAAADDLFAANVPLDAPYTERCRSIVTLRDRLGDFTQDPGRPAESDTPAHRRWWLTGPGGTTQVQIQLSPQLPPRVQSLAITIPPASDSALGKAVARIVEWLNDGGDWDLPVAAGTDPGPMTRRLRMAAVWAGRCEVAAWRAGDGTASTVAELKGQHAELRLTVAVHPVTGAIREAAAVELPQDVMQVTFGVGECIPIRTCSVSIVRALPAR